MALSTELINQFVKATNDKPSGESEVTLYGTVVETDGEKYVQLDGSDLLTPVILTTDVEDGERVTVLLKNHTATVTGNISSPSARRDTVRVLIDETGEIKENLDKTQGAVNNIAVGSKNLIRNSLNMIYEDYRFNYPQTSRLGNAMLGVMVLGKE